MLEEFPELIKSAAATPAADHLFKMLLQTADGKWLLEEQALVFHHFTAKLQDSLGGSGRFPWQQGGHTIST